MTPQSQSTSQPQRCPSPDAALPPSSDAVAVERYREALTATAHTRRCGISQGYYDLEDRWQCPACGQSQVLPPEADRVSVQECCECGRTVTVTYRNRKY